MTGYSRHLKIVVCTALAATLSPARVWAASDPSLPEEKFEQALRRTENLHLPLNRAYLYRQAAGAVSQKDKAEAILLLKRALSEINASDLGVRAATPVDEEAKAQLEAGRRLTIMQLLRIDSSETMRLLAPPQAADSDINLQRQVFGRLGGKSMDLVRDAAQRKLEYGVTPAVVAAYDVLCRHDAGLAKLFGTSIVFRLKAIDPAQDPVAVASAFVLLELQRSGGHDSKGNSASLLSADDLRTLYEFVGEAFLEALDPEVLNLAEKPAAYLQAMQQYAPEKADEVAKALAATPAVAPVGTQGTASGTPVAVGQRDAEALTLEEQKQEEAARVQVQARMNAQIKETATRTKSLSARIADKALTQEERDNALFAMVEETNRAISLGRALAKNLVPKAFEDGELEFYSYGLIAGAVESASSMLQHYALDHPDTAEDAASRLDGPEVQIEVQLQIAIREMNRSDSLEDRERHQGWNVEGPRRSAF
jgi:hypothetical protein